jgi:hypothetical protein
MYLRAACSHGHEESFAFISLKKYNVNYAEQRTLAFGSRVGCAPEMFRCMGDVGMKGLEYAGNGSEGKMAALVRDSLESFGMNSCTGACLC